MTISNIILNGLKETIDVLKKANLNWCLFGGLAMQVYKRIRATRDIDLIVLIASHEIPKIIAQMEKAGFKFDRQKGIIKIKDFELLRFNYIDKHTTFEIFIDLLTARTEFQRQILDRKIKTDFFGVEVNVASLEDLILLKILGNRPIDLIDVQVLIEENKKSIDKNYLINCAKRLGIQRKSQVLLKGNA